MKRFTAYGAGLASTSVAHLALIPILSLYGISVCPVLHSHGFFFGCEYTALFVTWIVLANAATLFGVVRLFGRTRFIRVLAAGTYLGAFLVGSLALISFLRAVHVPSPTVLKMGTALFYSGVLLGVLNQQIISWLSTVWARSSPLSKAPPEPAGTLPGIVLSWAKSVFWDLLPAGAALSVFAVFAYRVSQSLGASSALWRELFVVALLLIHWLLALRVFRLLEEWRLLKDVRGHLDALAMLDPSRFSTPEGPSFWSPIFRGLNRASSLIAERARLIRGFSAYVAKDVVSQVLSQEELKPEGKSCALTILTSDLRDFTRLSNSMPAEKVVQTLNVYFGDMIEVFIKGDVHLDKFIGDGILAYLRPQGSDLRTSNERGVRVALAMHEMLEKVTVPKLVDLGLPPLRLGVAVHSGDLVLGNIGVPVKMQYTIIGDPVNVASRLESFCKSLGVGVVISNEVYEGLPSDLQGLFQDFGEQEVRGVRNRVRLFGALPQAKVVYSSYA